MSIPIFLKFPAIMINGVKEEEVKEPEMHQIHPVQKVQLFKSSKECSPMSSKMHSNLNPQAFNA
jgi:hypothetical protein